MLKLIDLIQMAGVSLGTYKIHCATTPPNGDDPLDAFFDGRFKEWQEHQTRKNFNCDAIVSLIQYTRAHWLFAGVWSVNGCRRKTHADRSWYQYSTTELAGLDHLSGRVIVKFEKTFRNCYLQGPRYRDTLEIAELRQRRMSIGDFPGFASTLLTYQRLKVLFAQQLDTWRSALSSVSGIYVIVDTLTGKAYVGSACGVGGIWARWGAYAGTGHGGNTELKRLLNRKGKQYADNFQFAIVEICDLMVRKEDVQARETHWKQCLLTRKFGYNDN